MADRWQLLGEPTTVAYRVPAIPLRGVLSRRRVVLFCSVWFGINILFGLVSLPIDGNDQPVAWQAHIGGFLRRPVAVFLVRSDAAFTANRRFLLHRRIS